MSKNQLHFCTLKMKTPKRKRRKTILFTIVAKRIKHLGINTKEVKVLYNKNYHILLKVKTQRDTPCATQYGDYSKNTVLYI